jgi:hypothetical protein
MIATVVSSTFSATLFSSGVPAALPPPAQLDHRCPDPFRLGWSK